jgi:tRNA (guanine10-N2)-methyltransferase
VLLARYLLVPGGRLVFFLPTPNEEYDEVDIPVVEGMREIKFGEGSVQDFGKWGRRLITMEKVGEYHGDPPTFEDKEKTEGKQEGHFEFHHKVSLRSCV